MANTLQKFEARQVARLATGKSIPDFTIGDTVKVNIKIKEGERERVQAYEGIVIARFGGSENINASFTVRKISLGEGVERVFPLFSPSIETIELMRRGSVRRAKLYYLRDRRGKSARISERTTGYGIETQEEIAAAQTMTKTQKMAQKKEAKKVASEQARKGHEAKAKAKADAKAAEAAAPSEEKAE
jgi:large subunit ribosomal protein L19